MSDIQGGKISDLESRVSQLTQERDEMLLEWKGKASALEIAMDTLQSELTKLRDERDGANRELALSLAKCDSYQVTKMRK